uniref:Uncharacterized protein n=1 Tax=Arundo donax TaxID=35708 RepID=A0A0A8YIL6_ARUDO
MSSYSYWRTSKIKHWSNRG